MEMKNIELEIAISSLQRLFLLLELHVGEEQKLYSLTDTGFGRQE